MEKNLLKKAQQSFAEAYDLGLDIFQRKVSVSIPALLAFNRIMYYWLKRLEMLEEESGDAEMRRDYHDYLVRFETLSKCFAEIFFEYKEIILAYLQDDEGRTSEAQKDINAFIESVKDTEPYAHVDLTVYIK